MKQMIIFSFVCSSLWAQQGFDGGEFVASKHGGMCDDDDQLPVIEPVETMDFAYIRNCFPILTSTVHDKPLVFLDTAATAQMPEQVLDGIVDYYQHYKSNIGRGLYVFAEQATKAFEHARIKVARFINADKHEIVFTPGATAGINLVVHIWAQQHIQAGDEIIISEVEHNANFIPWLKLAEQKGAVLKRVPVNHDGVVDSSTLALYVTDKTKLVAITHQSNILGTINDVASLSAVAHAHGAKILVDAAQSIAHHHVDVQALDCDFLVFSGHKIFGPTGVGVLYLKKDLFDQCTLCNFGGGMVYGVTLDEIEFKDIPHALEPGTQAIAQVIGLGFAIDFVQKNINFAQAAAYESMLVQRLIDGISDLPRLHVISGRPREGFDVCLVTFYIDSIDAYDVAQYLDLCGVAVRAGYHCSQPYHDKLGGHHTVRCSFSVYNTVDEVDYVIKCMKKLLTSDLD